MRPRIHCAGETTQWRLPMKVGHAHMAPIGWCPISAPDGPGASAAPPWGSTREKVSSPSSNRWVRGTPHLHSTNILGMGYKLNTRGTARGQLQMHGGEKSKMDNSKCVGDNSKCMGHNFKCAGDNSNQCHSDRHTASRLSP